MVASPQRRSDILLLSLLLILGVLAGLVSWILIPPPKEGHPSRPPSTLLNRSYGTKALYLTLKQLGYEVTRLRRAYSPALLAEIESLVLMKPTIDLAEDDWEQLWEWVRDGGRLLLVASETVTSCTAESSEEIGWFNACSMKPSQEEEPERMEVKAGEHLAVGDSLFEGVSKVITRPTVRFVKDNPVTGKLKRVRHDPLWTDEHGLAGMRVRYGDGIILALADDYPFTNLGISEGDNIILAANLARELGGGDKYRVIGFDEFHHGFLERDPSWLAVAKLIFRDRWGWGLTQAALAGLIALFAAAVRFGRPAELVRRHRRRQSEYTIAAGRLLGSSHGAVEQVYPILHGHYRGEILDALGLDRDTDSPTLLDMLERRLGVVRGQKVGALLSNSEGVPSGSAGLLERIREIHEVVREIRNGNAVSG